MNSLTQNNDHLNDNTLKINKSQFSLKCYCRANKKKKYENSERHIILNVSKNKK